jgi:CTP:molybdopterin cytidylyltransferase MocA
VSAGGASQGAGGPVFTALVLAGSRGASDPVALSEGTSHKCLVDIAGVPMLARVLETLLASPSVGAVAISIEAPELLAGLPAVDAAVAAGKARILTSNATPSRSVLAALAALGDPSPVLITTADNPLVTVEMIEHFCAGALASGADVAAALAAKSVIESEFPGAERTYLRFRDGRFSGCNLFALTRPAGLAAVRFWAAAERHRKKPWRLMASFGLGSLVLFLLGRLTLAAAMARASTIMGARATVVRMPFPTAPIDVDKVSDLALVRRIVGARGSSG